MPALKKEILTFRVGNKTYKATPLPAATVAMANARIQGSVQPIMNQIKKTRRAAAITASKIILNA